MPTILDCFYSEQNHQFTTDDQDRGSYAITWDVEVDTEFIAGAYVLELARNVTPVDGKIFPVAEYGDAYKFYDSNDGGSYAQSFTGRLKDPKSSKRLWEFTAAYKPPKAGQLAARLQEPNPLKWPVEYYIEWIEDSVPIDKAYCMTRMDQISRGIRDDGTLYVETNVEPGPVVNAVGQQTIDPQMRTLYHPVLCVYKNCSSFLVSGALNRLYGDTANGPQQNGQKFLGDELRQWRFMFASSERLQQKVIKSLFNKTETNVSYYPTTVKLEFKKIGWDRLIVNNGMSTFSYPKSENIDTKKAGQGHNALILSAADSKGTANLRSKWDTSPVQVRSKPGSTTFVDSSEPMHLNLDGVQKKEDEPADHIAYRYLMDSDYSKMAIPLPDGTPQYLFP